MDTQPAFLGKSTPDGIRWCTFGPFSPSEALAYYTFDILGDVARADLKGALTVPWPAWTYGATDFEIPSDTVLPIVQAAQADASYTLGQKFRILWVPATAEAYPANGFGFNDPSGPVPQSHMSASVPVFEIIPA
jgi:hypothetical protein